MQRMKEIRKYYRKINKTQRVFKPRCYACRDKEGDLVTDKQKILERWCQHFEELLNGTGDKDMEYPEP